MWREKWICEPLRDLEQVTPPAFVVPKLSCDAHMHVFGSPDAYPSVAEPHYTLPEGSLEQYRAVADVLDLDRLVFVQPSYYGTDNTCLLDAMGRTPNRSRGVVFMPETVNAAEIDDLHARGVRGVRLDFVKAAQRGADKAVLLERLHAAVKLARSVGWHVELYAPGPAVRDLTDILPDLGIDVSVNHMGFMTVDDGTSDADFLRFVETMKSGSCWAKLTAPYRIADEAGQAKADNMARELISQAPDRLVWGSDWPHIPDGRRDTGEFLNRLASWCPNASVLEGILVANPARLYQFDD